MTCTDGCPHAVLLLPKPLLGIPPAWYKSLAYRSRAVSEPRAVLAEFGVARRAPEVRVHIYRHVRYLSCRADPRARRD